MLAARTVAKETIEFCEVPAPLPSPDHALIRVHHLTLCGTDLHIWQDDYTAELPLIQGHEFSGIVESIGANAAGIAVGDAVAVSPMSYCGSCRACQLGRYNVCESISCLGCYEDGALLELISVPVERLCPLPDGMPLDLAALGEPTSIAMQAVNRGRPVAGDTALVLGTGPIGLLAILYLSGLGIDVIGVDLDPGRLALARDFGAVRTLQITEGSSFPDAEQARVLAELTDGSGPSLLIEATGVPASLATAVELAASAGRIVQVGISDRPVTLPLKAIPFKELDILGSRNSLNLIPEALLLLDAHREQANALITHRFDFAELDAAFAALADRSRGVGKALINMPAALSGAAAIKTSAGANA